MDPLPNETQLLTCPVRGKLSASSLAKDGLTTTEEARRIEFIKFLLNRGYPEAHITVETIVIRNLGESGRNKLRADVIVYDRPKSAVTNEDPKDRLTFAILVAEIKRDAKSKQSGIDNQLEPALAQIPRMDALGVYWDDTNRILLFKSIEKRSGVDHVIISNDDIANLPQFGVAYRSEPITLSKLASPTNLVSLLFGIANIMRSHGINDEALRYRETVKLILARYCDEREARTSEKGELSLQVLQGSDHNFSNRIARCYEIAARRYNRAKTLFSPVEGSELPERTLREVIKHIQSVNFTEASNETMQQVFMSFVPSVFKKALDQYFTPIGLIETMVDMIQIGPNDTVLDPAMGTADFLTAAMDFRSHAGDDDILQRIYGADCDPKAFDLAVINMILNKDGQSNLQCIDTIERHEEWSGKIDVSLCNPPFGEKSLEKRKEVLSNYDLGHVWTQNSKTNTWSMTSGVASSQQLGILFIERCWKALSPGGRFAIILPEGYLCTRSYGYIRQWLVDNTRVLGVVELPRRIFTKSDADLRGNIVVCQKVDDGDLETLKSRDYPIFADIVRKVGFKMGAGFAPTVAKDPQTGLELRDGNNNLVIDSDFIGVRERFAEFSRRTLHTESLAKQPKSYSGWRGARITDVLTHPSLDLKPRRLSVRALENVRRINSSDYVELGQIADVVDAKFDLTETPAQLWRLIEGIDIRAVEGLVTPQFPVRSWEIVDRKQKNVYRAKYRDIVMGLVRPERRNIGLLLDKGEDIVATPDGISLIRVKEKFIEELPQLWLFHALRLENTRLQLWTESGGTSYGKLTPEHIKKVKLHRPDAEMIQQIAKSIDDWANSIEEAYLKWEETASSADRYPIINSPIFGLEPVDSPWE